MQQAVALNSSGCDCLCISEFIAVSVLNCNINYNEIVLKEIVCQHDKDSQT